jgi:hypothetical protein
LPLLCRKKTGTNSNPSTTEKTNSANPEAESRPIRYPNRPQAKRTLRLESIQSEGGVNPTVALQPSTGLKFMENSIQC